MPTPWQRDLEADGRKFEDWLRKQLPDARKLRISPLVSPTTSGFSNETLLFDLDYEEGGEARSEKLVARIQPMGFQVFPSYDLGLQFHTMRCLAATDVPVPEVRWLAADDRDVFGAPFYVMSQLSGRVPSDNPPYHVSGWFAEEATPAEREAIWLGGIDALAKIHAVDWRAAGMEFVDRREPGQSALQAEIAAYRRYYEWAARGRPNPTIEAGFEFIEANQPEDEPTGLQWGDARIGNIIYDGSTPAAVIDWEMVTLGSPEADLGWFIFLDRHHSEGIGQQRAQGLPGYDETCSYYSDCSGHRVRYLDYYQAWAGVRFGVIMMRIAQQLVHYEVMPEEAGLAFEHDNTVTRLLSKLLELPPPGEGAGTRGGFAGE